MSSVTSITKSYSSVFGVSLVGNLFKRYAFALQKLLAFLVTVIAFAFPTQLLASQSQSHKSSNSSEQAPQLYMVEMIRNEENWSVEAEDKWLQSTTDQLLKSGKVATSSKLWIREKSLYGKSHPGFTALLATATTAQIEEFKSSIPHANILHLPKFFDVYVYSDQFSELTLGRLFNQSRVALANHLSFASLEQLMVLEAAVNQQHETARTPKRIEEFRNTMLKNKPVIYQKIAELVFNYREIFNVIVSSGILHFQYPDLIKEIKFNIAEAISAFRITVESEGEKPKLLIADSIPNLQRDIAFAGHGAALAQILATHPAVPGFLPVRYFERALDVFAEKDNHYGEIALSQALPVLSDESNRLRTSLIEALVNHWASAKVSRSTVLNEIDILLSTGLINQVSYSSKTQDRYLEAAISAVNRWVYDAIVDHSSKIENEKNESDLVKHRKSLARMRIRLTSRLNEVKNNYPIFSGSNLNRFRPDLAESLNFTMTLLSGNTQNFACESVLGYLRSWPTKNSGDQK